MSSKTSGQRRSEGWKYGRTKERKKERSTGRKASEEGEKGVRRKEEVMYCRRLEMMGEGERREERRKEDQMNEQTKNAKDRGRKEKRKGGMEG